MGERTGGDDAITGINVTPLVDVTLVLLIVFMVTARTLATHGLPVEVPRAVKAEIAPPATFVVTIAPSGAMSVDGHAVGSGPALEGLARDAKSRSPLLKGVIRASPSTSHGVVVEAMDALRRADLKVALGVEPAR